MLGRRRPRKNGDQNPELGVAAFKPPNRKTNEPEIPNSTVLRKGTSALKSLESPLQNTEAKEKKRPKLAHPMALKRLRLRSGGCASPRRAQHGHELSGLHPSEAHGASEEEGITVLQGVGEHGALEEEGFPGGLGQEGL